MTKLKRKQMNIMKIAAFHISSEDLKIKRKEK